MPRPTHRALLKHLTATLRLLLLLWPAQQRREAHRLLLLRQLRRLRSTTQLLHQVSKQGVQGWGVTSNSAFTHGST
jgi:hypothetical protein